MLVAADHLSVTACSYRRKNSTTKKITMSKTGGTARQKIIETMREMSAAASGDGPGV
jgi:hypothetical protein